MAEQGQANAAERQRWNDDYWTAVWPKREQMTSAVTSVLLDRAGVCEGENVLDIGSGGGLTTIAAARLVGARGTVIGADISAVLVELARQRAVDGDARNVSFKVADVQHDAVPGMPFDVAISQFGVMFFDEPVTAFTNVHRQMRSGGRLGFACWQPIEKNPWFIGPAIAGYVPTPAPPAPGKSPTGPFSLSDPDRATAILTASGWSDVSHRPYEILVALDREAIVDDGQLAFLGVPDASSDKARLAVEEHLAPLQGADGQIQTQLAFQIFTATA